MARRKQNPDKMTLLILAGIAAAGAAVYIGYKRNKDAEDAEGFGPLESATLPPEALPGPNDMAAVVRRIDTTPRQLILTPTIRKGLLQSPAQRSGLVQV